MSKNQNEFFVRLSEVCREIETGSASPSRLKSIRELAPTITPELCPADCREDWLDLQLMIQDRPRGASGSGWFEKIRQFKVRLSAPVLAWR